MASRRPESQCSLPQPVWRDELVHDLRTILARQAADQAAIFSACLLVSQKVISGEKVYS
jgi:hypothetical protein